MCNMASQFFKDGDNNVGIDHDDGIGGLSGECLKDMDAVDVTEEPGCAGDQYPLLFLLHLKVFDQLPTVFLPMLL